MTDPVEVVITPSPAQYRQLVTDLAALRVAGAQSHTQALCEAVAHEAAKVRRERMKAA